MFAKYQGLTYLYSANTRRREIITSKAYKAKADFKKADGIYYKNVCEEDLTDIYNIEILAEYDSGLAHTPFIWQVNMNDFLEDNKVLLRFTNGLLPGWEIEENNVCRKYVDINELTSVKAVYYYKKKDGILFADHKQIEEEISISDTIKLCRDYSRENI